MKNLLSNIVVCSVALMLSACNLTVSTNPGGTVQLNIEVEACGTSSEGTYPDFLSSQCYSVGYNETVSLTATPDTGYQFDEWRGACEGEGSCSVSLNSAKSVTAVFSPLSTSLNIDDAFVDASNLIYLFDAETNILQRWNANKRYYLAPLDLGEDAQYVALSETNKQIYVAYQDGAVKRFAFEQDLLLEEFTQLSDYPLGLAVANQYVFAVDPTGAWDSHYLFSPEGILLDSREWSEYSAEYRWNPYTQKMYFYRDGSSPNDIHSQFIDIETGTFGEESESPYHGSYLIRHPIRVSADGQYVLTGSGDIYNSADLTLEHSLPIEVTDATWSDQALITIREQEGSTLLEQWVGTFVLSNWVEYPSNPRRVFNVQNGYILITEKEDELQFHHYEFTLDGDNDGVESLNDAFPLDPAASLDSDGDGYPDEWNDGYTESDSTSGLIIDAYPMDSACQLSEHGSNGVCDIANGIPDYTPDDVVVGDDGIVYLLSIAEQKVFRWSFADEYHLNPIFIGEGANLMEYATGHNTLFITYDTGEVKSIDSATLQMSSFTSLPQTPHGIAAMGNHLLLADSSGSWNTHYVYNLNGELLDSADWNRRSRGYAWDSNRNRIYFFRDGTSPNDLHFEEIDPDTGMIVAEGETPYHGTYNMYPPIRVSSNGETIVLGSGDIYHANDMSWVDSLGDPIVDLAWIADEDFAVLRESGDSTQLVQYSADLTIYNTQLFPGQPIAVRQYQGQFLVITLIGNQPEFHFYRPTDDSDSDGVVNTEDAFPLDIAASIDSDSDGYPDEWNPGYTQIDSTTSLILDAYPQDMACQTAAHGVDGVCDFAHIIPADESAICAIDNIESAQLNGVRQFNYPISDLVPLCSGWVIVTDTNEDKVNIEWVFGNRKGATYSLPANPGHMMLDDENKVLYVSLNSNDVAAIDLVSNAINLFSADGVITDMALGPANSLLVMTTSSTMAFDRTSGTALGSWDIDGSMIVFNPERNEIISAVQGNSPSSVYRYSFDLTLGATLLESSRSLGSNGQDLELSGDNQHLVFTAGSGNGSGYTIYDLDPSNLTNWYGEWESGAYPQSAAFSLNSDVLVTKNHANLLVYSTADYTLINSAEISSNANRVEVSRGNQIAYALFGDSLRDPTIGSIEWLIY